MELTEGWGGGGVKLKNLGGGRDFFGKKKILIGQKIFKKKKIFPVF